MKIKLLVALLASSLWCGWAQAQIGDITNPLNGRITVVDAGTCATANSFVMQQLPQNASTTTVNLSGTFTATLTARVSNNGGATWTTAGAVAAGTSSFSTNGFTQICVDSTAFTSGTVVVTISTGLLQVQSVVSGSSSSSPSSLAIGKFNTATFGSLGDAITINGCTSTSGSKIITCPSGAFAASDVGKITTGSAACLVVGTSNPIASFQSATQVTLTNNANATCTGNLFFSYGTNNLTAFQATGTAASTLLGSTQTAGSTFAPAFATVSIPCGRFMVEPTSGAGGIPVLNFAPSVANGGQALVEGCDGNGTEILAGEGWTFAIGGGTLIGSTNSNAQVAARGLTVNGLNQSFAGGISSSIIAVNGGGLLPSSSSEFLEITNFPFLAGSPNLNLIQCGNCIIRQSSAHDSANAVGFNFTGDVITYGLFGNNLGVGYHLAGVASARFLYDSIDVCTQLSGMNACMEIDGVSNNVRIIGSDFLVGATTNALDVNITAGNRVTLIGNRFLCSTGSGVGIRFISGDVHLLEQEPICGQSTSGVSALLNGANANLFDDGGNTWTNGSPNILSVLAGTYIPNSSGVVGKCTGVGTAASTLGLYGTGANEVLSTCTSTTIGNGITQTHSGSLFALYVTATAAGTNASSGVVTVLKNGATQTLTCTIGTVTSCKDEAHIISFVAGDLISIQFTTQAADTLAGVKATVAVQ